VSKAWPEDYWEDDGEEHGGPKQRAERTWAPDGRTVVLAAYHDGFGSDSWAAIVHVTKDGNLLTSYTRGHASMEAAKKMAEYVHGHFEQLLW